MRRPTTSFLYFSWPMTVVDASSRCRKLSLYWLHCVHKWLNTNILRFEELPPRNGHGKRFWFSIHFGCKSCLTFAKTCNFNIKAYPNLSSSVKGDGLYKKPSVRKLDQCCMMVTYVLKIGDSFVWTFNDFEMFLFFHKAIEILGNSNSK